jgi:hypothetical protein
MDLFCSGEPRSLKVLLRKRYSEMDNARMLQRCIQDNAPDDVLIDQDLTGDTRAFELLVLRYQSSSVLNLQEFGIIIIYLHC